MSSYKRQRTQSKYEEKNVQDYINTALNITTTITFTDAAPNTPSDNILLLGTDAQLAEERIRKLPFYTTEVGALIAKAVAGSGVVGTYVKGGASRVVVGKVPTVCSRTNCPTRPDAISDIISAAIKDIDATKSSTDAAGIDVFVCATEAVCVASAVAKGLPGLFSAKKGRAEKAYQANQPKLTVIFPDGTLSKNNIKKENLEAMAKCITLCRFLVDAPTNLLDTVTYTEIAAGYAAKLGCGIDIIMGEELRERGYGGVYGVGKAAEFPPALVTLTHKPKAGMDPNEKIALVGKGIVFDTGGLAIKTPAPNMCGMKADMGGSAAVFCGFLAAVMTGTKYEMSVTLCLADNAISARAQRNDDIIRMKSGLTVEVHNTDAEGRLVLGDGVYHASCELSFVPTTIIDMATLTGAQGVATGHKYAGIVANDGDAERQLIDAGRRVGDLAFPLVYAPEYHEAEYVSTVADMRNITLNPNNAASSCAGYFVLRHVSKEWKGKHVHVDLAYPAVSGKLGTGYGVSMIVQLYGGL